MSKQFWIVVAVIVIGLIAVFSLSGKNTPKTDGSTNSNTPTSHIEGQDKDNVTLVEWGDYQCPFCGEYSSTIKEVESLYNSDIHFQFRNFPLTSIHQNAFAGARAAEAAGLMGQFWQMHDLLYEQNQAYYNSNGSQPGWIGASNPETVFIQDASSLGLNTTKFQQLYASDQVNNLINADEGAGTALNIDATPSFFLDGKPVEISNSLSAFEKVLNAEIQKKTGKPAAIGSATASATAGTTSQSKQ